MHYRRGFRAAGLLFAATAVVAVLALAPRIRAAYGSPTPSAGAAPAAPNQLPPNPALDAKLKGYFQKRFLIPDEKHIQLGPLLKTPMPGMIARVVTVSNEKGQSVNAELFTDHTGNQFILGQMYDATQDPWQRTDLSAIHLNDRPALGPPAAPVTIVEFADFECPFCARAFGVLETMVHTTYKDKVKYIYKSYPLNGHPWAMRAAQAAECGRLQNPATFWEFARDFYTNQGGINPKNVDEHAEQTAKRLSLDLQVFKACMSGKSAAQRVQEDAQDGAKVGIASTPTFFVNGVRVVGLPEEKAFDYVVKSQLEEAAKGARK